MTYPRDLLADFVGRTKANLDLIRAERQRRKADGAPRGEGPYEVTQLLNSMLGLLVFPQQRALDVLIEAVESAPEEMVSRIRVWVEGCPRCQRNGTDGEDGGTGVPPCPYSQLSDPSGLVRMLRNGIAHFNLDLLGSHGGDITGLRVWNTKDEQRTWTAEIDLPDLERLFDFVTNRMLALARNRKITVTAVGGGSDDVPVLAVEGTAAAAILEVADGCATKAALLLDGAVRTAHEAWAAETARLGTRAEPLRVLSHTPDPPTGAGEDGPPRVTLTARSAEQVLEMAVNRKREAKLVATRIALLIGRRQPLLR
ncbi:hypothetical protein HL658_12500 [Azospirillum sp. RWY-5-1]|uniref:pEK499-p136 HEPN domain-containing protein n=1 Tax=Azospirillum oleiclasticum TaxID=2735135 RepID=A0ABX2T871_9PROT|nr:MULTISPECIES: HEPN family nuclease [Azospirillum]MBY6266558.1 hypothetical protein [Azospirillum sp. 412522]NYZ13373.1 hypothetical protein [Azospirillum oleiclasticum]NYZ20534.1 hypothetical protein [Azospirillum oleiclasticum]